MYKNMDENEQLKLQPINKKESCALKSTYYNEWHNLG